MNGLNKNIQIPFYNTSFKVLHHLTPGTSQLHLPRSLSFHQTQASFPSLKHTCSFSPQGLCTFHPCDHKHSAPSSLSGCLLVSISSGLPSNSTSPEQPQNSPQLMTDYEIHHTAVIDSKTLLRIVPSWLQTHMLIKIEAALNTHRIHRYTLERKLPKGRVFFFCLVHHCVFYAKCDSWCLQ